VRIGGVVVIHQGQVALRRQGAGYFFLYRHRGFFRRLRGGNRDRSRCRVGSGGRGRFSPIGEGRGGQTAHQQHQRRQGAAELIPCFHPCPPCCQKSPLRQSGPQGSGLH